MLNFHDRPAPAGPDTNAGARRACLRVLLLAACALALAGRAQALDSVTVLSAELQAREDPEPGLYLNAQFAFDTPPAIEDAVRRGIPVYFAIDFELVRTRWYWFNKPLVSAVLGYRVSYSPLTRQFRLSRGALAQPFDTLAEAFATIRTVRNWKVAGAGQIDTSEHLLARLRLRLDTSMLPKPFQVDALTNQDWALASDWQPVRIRSDIAK